MLFTGDAETDEREWLMEHHPGLLRTSVLKASHHGSINGADGGVGETSWMEAVAPERVVISAHLESRHGHPDPEAVDIYEDQVGHAAVYCTSRHGTLRIYGREDGGMAIYRQFPFEGSCDFPGGGSSTSQKSLQGRMGATFILIWTGWTARTGIFAMVDESFVVLASIY